MSGNSGLTSREIYQSIEKSGSRYNVLSGATTEQAKLGEVPLFHLNGKLLRVFEGREGILVARKGKAGASAFLAAGRYTLTDDGYIVYLRSDCPYEISLEWFAFQFQTLFYEYSSTSDNGTWNMTGFFDTAQIDIPVLGEQEMFLLRYRKLIEMEEHLKVASNSIDTLLSKRIV
jgi:hypothetical protein